MSESLQARLLPVICIGGGPAGLTAAYTLLKNGHPAEVLEADTTYVGGISRTINWGGFHFDIGGHRFFSKSDEITALWKEILPDDFLTRPRKSRIFYKGKFYPYPLNIAKTVANLGIVESGLCGLSALKAMTFPMRNPRTFEQWVSNQFGTRLFNTFFKTYTEKVWGMSCSEISADWAQQRIKGLSLMSAVKNAAMSAFGLKSGKNIKTLIEEFQYPRRGPGMMWEAATRHIESMGGSVHMGCRAESLAYDKTAGLWHVGYRKADGTRAEFLAKEVISSMPICDLIKAMPAAPGPVKTAAASLRYRDFITVALVLQDSQVFDDNWIYIHDPKVKVGRIQNFKAWSPEMVPDDSYVCYGLEYFCFEGDGLWNTPDDELIALASKELAEIGLAGKGGTLKGYVVRQPKAYPVYDSEYERHVDTIRAWIAENCPGLQLVGRNGMHKYNNQDHSMMTAILAAHNILEGGRPYDVWQVNQDAIYHEEVGKGEASSGASGERLVPRAHRHN